jgi:hypothetical protein
MASHRTVVKGLPGFQFWLELELLPDAWLAALPPHP